MNNKNYQGISIIRIIIKSVSLLILFNFLFILCRNIPYGSFSLYNAVFPGRERLPFGETPNDSFNITISNLDAMLNSHKISADKKSESDYRIIILGDSSIWGFLQKPEETLAGLIEMENDFECGEKKIEVFNLGYPSLSIVKDLLILNKIKAYDPDLILWFVTLESLVSDEQLDIPLVKNNPLELNRVIDKYQLSYPKTEINLLDYSIIGQRRNLADIIRLQLHGVNWAGTGIDLVIPEKYTPAMRDFEADDSFKDFTVRKLHPGDLAIEVVTNTVAEFNEVDFLVINEPILISNGVNSTIRYNYYYPRWAYDDFRNIIEPVLRQSGIKYYDFWDLIPEVEFTNSAIHLTNAGENILAAETIALIKQNCESREENEKTS